MKRVLILLAFGLVAVPSVAVAAPTADKVEDYRVSLSNTPPVSVSVAELDADHLDLVQKYCTLPGIPPEIGVPFPCVNFPVKVADAGNTVGGTATNAAKRRTGDFSLSCDFVFPAKTSVTVSLPADYKPKAGDVVLDALSGQGPIGCAWSIVFGASGSVSGTAKGTVAISRVPGLQKVSAVVKVTVKITAGTGPYAAAVGGSGAYADTYETVWTPATAGGARAAARAAVAQAAVADGTLRLTLGRGKSGAAIVPVTSALAKNDPRRLRVVAPKGARCSASATSGTRKVSLGSAKVARVGMPATFPGTLRSRLTRTGSWKIAASCSSGGKTLKAPGATVRIS